jgi:SAM-dependent methyltransferase
VERDFEFASGLQFIPTGRAGLSSQRVFDQKHYGLLNTARGDSVKSLLSEVKSRMDLKTAIDVGCGLGHFSGLLASFGLKVTGLDGRRENAEEAARRFVDVEFRTMNAEDGTVRSIGTFDLTLCFGLLYHLENPFAVVRNLHAITKDLLLLESVIYQGNDPVMVLVDETNHEDQGLDHVAFYPTEACLIQMLFRSGFKHIYRFANAPDHPDFTSTAERRRVRTILAASRESVESTLLLAVEDQKSNIEPWNPKTCVRSIGEKSRTRSLGLKLLRGRLR